MNKGKCRHTICEEARQEVAREIFEEIEKYFCDNEYKSGFLSYCNFYNLKKKYTEGET